jgi:hypothetical protein
MDEATERASERTLRQEAAKSPKKRKPKPRRRGR